MLVLGGLAVSRDAARRAMEIAISWGRAADKFREIVEAQGGDPAVVDEKPEDMLSAGGIVAGIGLPNAANSWRRADRLRLDPELTLKVLEAKRSKRRHGRWPERIAGMETSVLGEPHWAYLVDGRRMRIGLSAPLEWKNWNGVDLPLEFTSE